MVKTKAKCVVCGKITALRQPYGEGTSFLPRRHQVNGVACPGNVREAELVDFVDGKPANKVLQPTAGTCPHLSAEFDYICMRCDELVPASRR